jgi:hypothetical protein
VTDATTSTSTSSSESNTSSSSSDNSDNSNNLGVIVGATVGVVVGIFLVALGAFLVWRKRRAGRARGREPGKFQTTEAYSALAMEPKTPTTLVSELPTMNRPAELSSPRNLYELPN